MNLFYDPNCNLAACQSVSGSIPSIKVTVMADATVLNSPVTQGLNGRSVVADSEWIVGSDVDIPNPPDVDGYLVEHPALRSLLPQICERVRAEFGRDAELTVELYRDREIDDRYLTLFVRQAQYDANIIERLDQLTELFAGELDRCTGDILLTTDFRPARSQHAV